MRRSALLPLIFLAISTWSLALPPRPALACEPGVCVNQTVPADQATDVPVDARLFVFFDVAGDHTAFVDGLTLVEDATGQTVLTNIEVVSGGNPQSEVHNLVAVLEPFGGMLPNTSYRVEFDGGGSVCGEPSLAFTTGDGTAVTPTFDGATNLTASCVPAPESPTDCNDQSIFPRWHFALDGAPPEEPVAGYRVLRDGSQLALLPELPANINLVEGDLKPEECFILQAIGLNGTEDGNDVEVCQTTDDVCATEVGDMGTGDVGTGDMDAPDLGDAGVPDVGDQPDGGATVESDADSTPTGRAGDSGAGDTAGSDGCQCSTAGFDIDASVLALLLVTVFGFVRRRQAARR